MYNTNIQIENGEIFCFHGEFSML